MAGKVKKKGDDAPQSKTARASLRTGAAKAEFIAAADAPRIVPLGGGTHAYILDPRDGKTRRFKVSSDEFFGMLATLDEAGHGDRMRRDLNELANRYPTSGWSQAIARVDGPGRRRGSRGRGRREAAVRRERRLVRRSSLQSGRCPRGPAALSPEPVPTYAALVKRHPVTRISSRVQEIGTGDTADDRSDADDLIHRIMATPEGHADPYPLYHRLREAAPIHRSGLDGVWYVSGFDACRQILGDTRIGKNDQFIVPRHGVDPERVRLAQRRRRPSMLTANPPEHTRLRGAAKGAFIPPTMEALRPRVAAIVAERLDRLAALGEADLMAELAFPMPVTVVGEMVGVPEEDRAWFRPLMRTLVSSDSFKRSPEALAEVERAGDELDAYFVELIARRRKEPADDLLSYFIAQTDDGLLDEDELFSTVTLLFFAGFLTTTNLIGNGLVSLFEHPDEHGPSVEPARSGRLGRGGDPPLRLAGPVRPPQRAGGLRAGRAPSRRRRHRDDPPGRRQP